MNFLRDEWRTAIYSGLGRLAEKYGVELSGGEDSILLETPPNLELGDLSTPLFPWAKLFKAGPPKLAAELAEIVSAADCPAGSVKAVGPYLNIFFERAAAVSQFLAAGTAAVLVEGGEGPLKGRRILLEFSCPNTNKPLHLGHLRNNALGASMAGILKAAGADVLKVNLINDRGVHICKSMLAYKKFGEGKTPESEGIKSDHFVGDYYVKFANWANEHPEAEKEAQEMLVAWEAGDPETVALWKRMNEWAIGGILETYERTGISFDKYYYESQTYMLGKEAILDGLKRGIFEKDDSETGKGAVMADLSAINLEKKVLLRGDGTSLYITQDIGTAISRHEDWPFDSMVYVVASEQQYHFKVLFHVLEQLGYEWAKNCYHLSYGMVFLPDGKMKSREGTVVDADVLLEQLSDLALAEIKAKQREEAIEDLPATTRGIALGALNYYLLQNSPNKDMVFDARESLSFIGNTGPYLQYTCARINSLLGKAGCDAAVPVSGADLSLLISDVEWELATCLNGFRQAVWTAAKDYAPSVLCSYLYELAKTFSRFYHDVPVLAAEPAGLAAARLELSRFVLHVLRQGLQILNIPFLASM